MAPPLNASRPHLSGDASPPSEPLDPTLREITLGVHRVVLYDDPAGCWTRFKKFSSDGRGYWASAKRLFCDLASINFTLFTLWLVFHVGTCLEPVFALAVEVKLLRMIENGLAGHPSAFGDTLEALSIRTLCSALFPIVDRLRQDLGVNLKTAMQLHYEEILLKAKFNRRTPLKDDKNYNQFEPESAYKALEDTIALVMGLTVFMLDMTLVITVLRFGSHGLFLFLLCLIPTTLDLFCSKNLSILPRWTQAINPSYRRLRSIWTLTEEKYQHDILSSNLSQYVINEYQKARRALGAVPLETPHNLYRMRGMPWFVLTFKGIAGDFPMIYYMYNTSHRLSVADLATLLQASQRFRTAFTSIFWTWDHFKTAIVHMKEWHDLQDLTESQIPDGIAYPLTGTNKCGGMALEMRDVSFSYPGKKTSNGLHNISVSISAGSMVLIVGGNGSGKSTFINMLTRMYDPSSGEVLVDGEDIRNLKLQDVRAATAILDHKHQLLPVPLSENITLGRPEAVDDEESIMRAVNLGGAKAIVESLKLNTTLQPYKEERSPAIVDPTNMKHPLNRSWDTGEHQRFLAARTFMRMDDPKIKLIVMDEPSSHLDPRGEEELFGNVSKERKGRTVIITTHGRLEKLARDADLILCMDEGKIVEMGKHSDLLEKKGEYHRLFGKETNSAGLSTSPSD